LADSSWGVSFLQQKDEKLGQLAFFIFLFSGESITPLGGDAMWQYVFFDNLNSDLKKNFFFLSFSLSLL